MPSAAHRSNRSQSGGPCKPPVSPFGATLQIRSRAVVGIDSSPRKRSQEQLQPENLRSEDRPGRMGPD